MSATTRTPSIYFSAREAGDVAVERAYHANTPGGSAYQTSYWAEPDPHEALTGYGLAVSTRDAGLTNWATTPSGVWYCADGGSSDVSSRLVACSYTIRPTSAAGRAVFDNADGGMDALTALYPGATLSLSPGYLSSASGTAQYGVISTFLVDAVTREVRDGKRTMTLELTGLWERLARWHAPQAWQIASGVDSRSATFARILARAGVPVSDTGGSDWTTLTPGFALSPGESAKTAARRLTAVAAEVFVPHSSDMKIVPRPSSSSYTYGPDDHVTTRLRVSSGQRPTNWTRSQGADRYSDAHAFDAIYRDGAALQHTRNLDADTDAKSDTYAVNALDRLPASAGKLTAPFNAGQQVHDVITIDDSRVASSSTYRVIAAGLDYSRGPRGARYDSHLELVEV